MEDKREINAMWRNGSMGSIEEACDRIKQLHDWDQQTIAGLRNRIKDMEDIHYKDNEIQKMQEKMRMMEHDYNQGFPISDEESVAIQAWQKQHAESYHQGHVPTGVSGGNWKYEFIPTSVGTAKYCICGTCYKKAEEMAFANEEDWTKHDIAKKYISMYDASFEFSDWI